MNSFWILAKGTYRQWSDNHTSTLAAALAYFMIFSLAPLLIIAVVVAGLVYGRDEARGTLVAQIGDVVGEEGAAQIETMLQEAQDTQEGTLATILSALVLLYGASKIFTQLRRSLNLIWHIEPKPSGGILRLVWSHLLALAMVLLIGVLLLSMLVATTALQVVGDHYGDLLPGGGYLWQLLNLVIVFAVFTLLFACAFKFLPSAEIVWHDVWVGAAATSLLFTVGQFLLGIYLSQSATGSVYGAAGSLIVLLVWIYYSAMMFLLGAEFTYVYSQHFGSQIEPNKHAQSA
jgi:membrane protein